jgi:hypothetical protein
VVGRKDVKSVKGGKESIALPVTENLVGACLYTGRSRLDGREDAPFVLRHVETKQMFDCL